MQFHLRRRSASNRSLRGTFESLEARQLLAGDLLSALGGIEVRSYDGTGNNLANPEWGSTNEQLIRIAPVDYADGISTPAGEDRPSAREISNTLAAQDEETVANDRQLSAFIYVWGQFVDHDIDLTQPDSTNPEYFNIEVPTGDSYFDPDAAGSQMIPLIRSEFDTSTGTDADNPRQQISEITAWLDGSVIYGNSEAMANLMRSFEGGRMLTSDGDLPPVDENGSFIAGDVRANENVELTSLHTLFVREHNRWANRIAADDPSLSDEEIFQRARTMVTADVQAITYNEFLPALLGRDALGPYQGYDPSVDPTIANEFSTAAYRLGHSLINDDVEFFGNDGRAVRDEIELADAFFNPALLQETGIDSILKYAASSLSQELDNQLVDGLRNFLFGEPGQGGLDLASLNIQRGRDHGLADYNSVREAYGLARVERFDQISSDPEVQQMLQELYGTVDNVDLWVGALAEDHVAGASVGELVRTIAVDQFQRIRAGDRLWYENVFSDSQVERIERTSLADIIERNTTVRGLQDDVFFLRAEISGTVFDDRDGDGRQGRRESALAGITVELLDDEGEVIATTVTNSRGRYRFTQFAETGDYQVRVVLQDHQSVRRGNTRDVLIATGDVALRNVDFGIATSRRDGDGGGRDDRDGRDRDKRRR